LTPKQSIALELARDIEAEMKKLRIWSPATNAASSTTGAFGANSMTFEGWLQAVFIPNLIQAAFANSFPGTSQVAVAATRNLDGLEGTDRLLQLLSQVDQLINAT
jgi:uncharacterized protein YqcC (DUF446 family)